MEKELKELVEDIVKKIKDDPGLMESFKKDPVQSLEAMTGKDLPDQMIEPLIAGIKARLSSDKLGNALGKLASLFGK